MRLIFMGSPELAVPPLQSLYTADYNIVAVYTQPDRPAGRGRSLVQPPVKKAALEMGLPVVQPESLKSDGEVSRLAGYQPDIIVVCAYGQILTQALLDVPPRQCINVHFSLLPRHRGASPVAAAILAGDDITGISIQLVRVKLDSGPVLASASVSISQWDNTGTLGNKLSIVGAQLLQEALGGWLRQERKALPQDETKATYFSRIKKGAGEIDWQQPAVDIWRRVRAYNPWPGSYTSWRGKQLKVMKAVPLPARPDTIPGQVIPLAGHETAFGIGTGDGVLGITRVQLEGKKAVSSADFLHGQRDFTGVRLPS